MTTISGTWTYDTGIDVPWKDNVFSIFDIDTLNLEVNQSITSITYANPHVYLDTVVLLGSISANFYSKISFGSGAIIASFVFFFSLGYFSNFLSKFVNSKKVWFYIDNTMGVLMLFYGLFFIFIN